MGTLMLPRQYFELGGIGFACSKLGSARLNTMPKFE